MDTFIFIFEIIGTAAFAFSGATIAIQCELDLLGIVILGIVTAVGGGVIRDVVLGCFPPRIFSDPLFVIIAVAISLVIFFLTKIEISKKYNKTDSVNDMKASDTTGFLSFTVVGVDVGDAIGLAVFTVIGVETGYAAFDNCNMFLAVFVGVVTGVGGGILRDILSGLKPYIFVKDIYALSSFSGAFIYAISRNMIGSQFAMPLGMVIIIILRILSIKFEWNLPKAKG